MQSCYRILVTGRVQGVFFRASTRNKAQQLGLQGWVRNTRYGKVELVACGELQSIEKLLDWLWQGPKFAKVKGVESVVDSTVGRMEGFEVRRDV